MLAVICISSEEVHKNSRKVFDATYLADLDKLVASIQISAQDLMLWRHDYRIKFDDGSVKWLQGNAIHEREVDVFYPMVCP